MEPSQQRRSPLWGRYLVQNPLLWWALSAADRLLGLLPTARGSATAKRGSPQRILLANGGHLGDVVVASAVLPIIRSAWPEAEVGFLIGSWSRVVLEGHPSVRWVHTVDHWKLNRSRKSFAAKLRQYRTSRRAALQEIRSVGYDLAIDLYAFFPNTIPLLWQAGIPGRVGYQSGGFGPLLTHQVTWRDSDRHMAECHLDLLEAAGLAWTRRPDPRYSLPHNPEAHFKVHASAGLHGDYVLIHMGAGSRLKEWPSEKWRAVIERLYQAGHTLVFTGNGGDQAREAELVIQGLEGCHNLCDQLSWAEFVDVVRRARLVVSVDSVAGHIAAAVGSPSVVLTTGMTNFHQWRPLDEGSLVVTNPVPCAPCHRSRGCATMACIREIPPERVWQLIAQQLDAGGSDTSPSCSPRAGSTAGRG